MRISADKRCVLITRSLEIDLREWIRKDILINKKLKECIDNENYNKLKLRSIKSKESLGDVVNENEIDDNDIVEELDYGSSFHLILKNKDALQKQNLKIFLNLNQDLKNIIPIRNKCHHGRNLMAHEDDTVKIFCEKINQYSEIFPETINDYKSLNEGNDTYEDQDYTDDDRNPNHNIPRLSTTETGFIDRKDLNFKISKVFKNFPLISFIGDGGTGKTELVKKIGFDFMQKEEFERCIFHTFKSEEFSDGEIKILEGNVNASGKFFSSSNWELLDNDPITNIIKNLESQKTLLILDNLETFIDQKRDLLLDKFAESETNGSKIFITSREPVAHGTPIKVGPFTFTEALAFYRKITDFYQLDTFKKLSDDEVKKYLEKVFRNPLFIKLAVGLLAEGEEIEQAFKPSKNQMNYLYEKTFNKLSATSKEILKLLNSVKRELNISEIIDLLEKIEPEDITAAIKDLNTKQFIIQKIKQGGLTSYDLRREVIPFIQKNDYFKFDAIQNLKIQKKYTQISSAQDHVPLNYKEAENGTLDVDWREMVRKNDSEKLASQKCSNIMNFILTRQKTLNLIENGVDVENNTMKIKKWGDQIEKDLQKLKISHPNYCETYRVEANYHLTNLNVNKMKESFEIAIRKYPKYINLHIYYASALRDAQETDAFYKKAQENIKIIPDGTEAKGEAYIALLESHLRKKISNKTTKEVYLKTESFVKEKIPHRHKRKIVNSLVRFHKSEMELFILEKKFNDAFNSLNKMFEVFYDYEKKDLVDFFTVSSNISKTDRFIGDIMKHLPKELPLLIQRRNEIDVLKNKYPSINQLMKLDKYNRPKFNPKLAVEGNYYQGELVEKLTGFALMNDSIYFPVRKNSVDRRVTVYVEKNELPKSAKLGSLLNFKLSTHASRNHSYQSKDGKTLPIISYVAKDVSLIKIK